MSQLALAWVMAKPGITKVLAGTRNLSQLEENLQAASLFISSKVVRQLDKLTKPLLRKLDPNADYWQSGESSRTR